MPVASNILHQPGAIVRRNFTVRISPRVLQQGVCEGDLRFDQRVKRRLGPFEHVRWEREFARRAFSHFDMSMKLAKAPLLFTLMPAAVWAQVNVGEQKPEASLPFTMTTVATFKLPWRLAFLPDGRMLVTENGTSE